MSVVWCSYYRNWFSSYRIPDVFEIFWNIYFFHDVAFYGYKRFFSILAFCDWVVIQKFFQKQ